jgi:ribosomal protein S18 acetylase RimI-like enzyme
MLTLKPVSHPTELLGILDLQRRNLRKNLSESEAAEQGFLIAEYTLESLERMNAARPSIVAVDGDGDQVAGYVIATTREVGLMDPFLADLIRQIDRLEFDGESLSKVDYVVVGQLCVDKRYRGQGLVPRLYQHFRASLEPHYRYGITEVARLNVRSLKAHAAVGFQAIHTIESSGLEWSVVLWDWRKG